MIPRTFNSDDRAVSIAVTHVLTIGITTILITGLLVGGSGLLRDEKQTAQKTELRTIGNRMASEVSSVWYSADDVSGGTMVVRVSHPEYVAGDNYRVEIRIEGNCNGPAIPDGPDSQCLVLRTPGGGSNEVFVPLDPNIELPGTLPSVQGGNVYIIVKENGDDLELTLSNDPPSPSPSLAPPEVVI